MLCELKNTEGNVDAIICGNEKVEKFCSSDQWCTDPFNVKKSYWTSNTFPANSGCFNGGK